MVNKRLNEVESTLLRKIKKARLSGVTAEELERQNEKLRNAFAKGRQDAAEEHMKLDSVSITYPNVKEKGVMHIPPEPSNGDLITVTQAKRIEAQTKKLREEFDNVQTKEVLEKKEREKEFEPITSAIKEMKPTTSTIQQNRVRLQNLKAMKKRLQPPEIRPRAMSTPGRDTLNDDDELDASAADQSLVDYVEQKRTDLGPIATKYLPEARDSTFGIRYDLGDQQLKIGNSKITIASNDIVLKKGGDRYAGTEGLWTLLTDPGYIDDERYTPDDREAYKDILTKTDALYQNNDYTMGRPKASVGQKWKRVIKPIWDEHRLEQMRAEVFTGKGLKIYGDNPIEYKYIGDFKELIDRLLYIQAQEAAGNNNFHNEKMSVVKFIHDRMEELITKPNGLKYVVRCLAALPENTVKGSGLLNDIINQLPFELHAPGYNFMGPGTKLQERLKRGDRGINPLDEAAREHDIWYSKYKNAEERWVADKMLQDKAFERVIANDADVNERLWGLAAGTAMWAKRKLGLGLSTSGCVYPV